MNSVECIRNLESAGVKVIASRDSEIYCLCPFHEDRRTSMSVNWEKGQWICFAGCGAGGLRTLWERLDYTPEESDEVELRLSLDERGESPQLQTIGLSQRLRKHINARLCRVHPSERSLKYSWMSIDSVIDRFSIGMVKVGSLRDDVYSEFESMVFPSRKLGGNIVGYVTQCPGQKAICVGNAKRACFGLWESWGCSRHENTLVIVEGVFDALCVFLCGYRVAALLGCSMRKQQLYQILTASDDIVLFLDSDAPGRRGTDKIVDMLLAESVIPRVVDWGNETKRDPADLSREEIGFYINLAKPASDGLHLDC